MTFSELMKDLRKKEGLTQKQAAEKIGCSESSVQNWERGLKNGSAILPNISDTEQILNISKVYSCNYTTIYNAIVSENKNNLDKVNNQLRVYPFLSDELEMLTLSEDELSVLMILGLNEKLNESNAMSSLLNKFNNPVIVSNYLHKLETMKLTEGGKLLEKGAYIYNVSSTKMLNFFNPHVLTPKELIALLKITTGLGNSLEKAIRLILHVYENKSLYLIRELFDCETYVGVFENFFNVEIDESEKVKKFVITLTYEGIQFLEFVKENFDLNMFQ